jgi:hypothetical protein
MCTTGPGRWQLEILPILNIPEDRRKNTFNATRATTALYENILRESPSDVLWMHNYWRVGKHRPLGIDGMQKEDPAEMITQPFRILVYTGDHGGDQTESIQQLERLKAYPMGIHLTTVGDHHLYSDSDHHIPCDSTAPPHLISNSIRRYNLDSSAPIDCALDFTDNGEGGKLLAKSGLDRIMCRRGKWMSKRTRALLKKEGNVTIAAFLTSLGLKDKPE